MAGLSRVLAAAAAACALAGAGVGGASAARHAPNEVDHTLTPGHVDGVTTHAPAAGGAASPTNGVAAALDALEADFAALAGACPADTVKEIEAEFASLKKVVHPKKPLLPMPGQESSSGSGPSSKKLLAALRADLQSFRGVCDHKKIAAFEAELGQIREAADLLQGGEAVDKAETALGEAADLAAGASGSEESGGGSSDGGETSSASSASSSPNGNAYQRAELARQVARRVGEIEKKHVKVVEAVKDEIKALEERKAKMDAEDGTAAAAPESDESASGSEEEASGEEEPSSSEPDEESS